MSARRACPRDRGPGLGRAHGTVQPMRQLVVLTGPIGSGKSTVAERLGHGCAAAGLTAAIADLDDIAFSHRGAIDLPDFWRRAGVAHVGLVEGWFAAGVDIVIAHGPFLESETYEELFATVEPDGRAHHVLLVVTVEVALARVIADADRGPHAASRDPAFLRATHEAFAELAPRLPQVDLALDATAIGASDIAARIMDLIH